MTTFIGGLVMDRLMARARRSCNRRSLHYDCAAMTLTHLQRLEAEAMHIFREAVAETEKPVML